jgi:phage tail-like protein
MPARSFVPGNFQLMLDGIACGFLKSVDGGAAVSQVVSEVGPAYFAKKHLGPLSYAPFVLQAGLAMSNNLYEWINASWTGKYVRKNGAVVATDQKLVAVSQREFFNALITETTIPALDGSSKDPAYLTLKVAPEYTRSSKASGKAAGLPKTTQKVWLPSNFRVTIDGLDCTKVRAVESFSVTQKVATDDIGDARDYQREPGKVEFPNLTITLAEVSAQSWFDWFDDFVIKGNSDESKEKKGSIAFLSPNRQDELLRIDLFNLGIFSLGSDKAEANSDRVATVTAHLYCERMEFHVAPAAVAARKAAPVRKTAGARKAAPARSVKARRRG